MCRVPRCSASGAWARHCRRNGHRRAGAVHVRHRHDRRAPLTTRRRSGDGRQGSGAFSSPGPASKMLWSTIPGSRSVICRKHGMALYRLVAAFALRLHVGNASCHACRVGCCRHVTSALVRSFTDRATVMIRRRGHSRASWGSGKKMATSGQRSVRHRSCRHQMLQYCLVKHSLQRPRGETRAVTHP